VSLRSEGYLERLGARMDAVGSCLCLGLDPDPETLPDGFPADIVGVQRFAKLLLEEAAPHAAAIKANLAFFEAFGSAGIAVLERLRASIPADVPFIIDAKRADIGTTAERQAVALFDALGADAVTANPYLGLDALAPLLDREDRFVYVLCRTSNPGAGDLQNVELTGSAAGGLGDSGEYDSGSAVPLYLHVARLAAGWADRRPRIGLVCGATAPAEMARIRAAAPELPFLVPGAGAQGGDVAAVLEHGPARGGAAGRLRGGALLVNVSRAIAGAAGGSADAATAVRTAARDWSATLRC
jgi:orotidine-5'-phosphate decarboxylase